MTLLVQRLSGYFPALLGLALPTVFITADSDSFILPRASIVIAGACLGIGLALLLPETPSLGSLRWPLLAAAAAALLAFAFSVSHPLSFAGSYTRYESLPIRLSYLGLMAASFSLLRTERHRDWLVVAFVVGTSVASFEAILQWGGHVPFRPDGNLGNANLLAALVVMAVPLAIDRALREGWLAAAWAAALVALGVGLWATTSRSGALGVVAGVAALAAFAIRPRRLAAAAGVIGTAVVALAVLFIQLSPLRALNDDPASLRIHLWEDGLRMVASRPLTGYGEDTTGLAFGRFLSQDYASLVTFDRIHSGPLDIAATEGLLGLLALTWVLTVVFVAAWRSRLERGVAGMAAALIGYTLWVIFNFDWAPATGAFWLLAGALWSAASSPPRSRGRAREGSRIWQPALAVLLVIPATVLGVLPVVADAYYVRGHSVQAVGLDPLQAQYHWAIGTLTELRRAAELGETEPSMYVELGDLELRAGNREAARDAYNRALVIDPYYTPAQQRLATLGPQ